jgi:hypothetical protein
VSVIQSRSTSASGAATISITFTSTTTTGSTLTGQATFWNGTTGSFVTPTDNKGNTYTPIGTQQLANTNATHDWYVEAAAGGASHQVTFDHSVASGDWSCSVGELSASTFVTTNQATGTSTAANSGSVSGTVGDDFMGFCAADTFAVGEPGAGSGWTQLQLIDGTSFPVVSLTTRNDIASGAATWTLTSHPWAAKVAVFTGAAPGGQTLPPDDRGAVAPVVLVPLVTVPVGRM